MELFGGTWFLFSYIPVMLLNCKAKTDCINIIQNCLIHKILEDKFSHGFEPPIYGRLLWTIFFCTLMFFSKLCVLKRLNNQYLSHIPSAYWPGVSLPGPDGTRVYLLKPCFIGDLTYKWVGFSYWINGEMVHCTFWTMGSWPPVPVTLLFHVLVPSSASPE